LVRTPDRRPCPVAYALGSATPAFFTLKILIIEDEAAIRDTLRDLLELNGHTVLAAPDGPEGIGLAAAGPDLIFCDIGLPGMDGYEVIAAVRRIPACHDIPFVFLTARAERDDQRRGMALGADDSQPPPMTPPRKGISYQ
jgi:CheY-like chemotaxis protein